MVVLKDARIVQARLLGAFLRMDPYFYKLYNTAQIANLADGREFPCACSPSPTTIGQALSTVLTVHLVSGLCSFERAIVSVNSQTTDPKLAGRGNLCATVLLNLAASTVMSKSRCTTLQCTHLWHSSLGRDMLHA